MAEFVIRVGSRSAKVCGPTMKIGSSPIRNIVFFSTPTAWAVKRRARWPAAWPPKSSRRFAGSSLARCYRSCRQGHAGRGESGDHCRRRQAAPPAAASAPPPSSPFIKTIRYLSAGLGDSRAYLIRGDRVEQLTMDHTIADALERNGTLTPDQARNSPCTRFCTSFSVAQK